MAAVPVLFGGTLLAVPFLLDQLTLPSDLLELFVSVDVINSRFGTLASAMHYATIGLLGTIAMVGRLRLRWVSLAGFALISVALFAALLFGVRAFYTHVVIAPYTKAETLKGLHFLVNPQPMTVYDAIPPTLEKSGTAPASLAAILERGVIRFCFQPDEYPSAFYNSENPPQLVGFDIEMAHRFAQRLRLPTEFIAARDQKAAAEMLNAGACDLYMRTLVVTAGRTRVFGLTSPIYTSSIGLIVRDHRRDEFRRWEQVYNLGASLRLAVEATPGNLTRVQFLLPKAKVVPITNQEEQRRILESDDAGVDAIIDMAEEGAAWTLLYPSFSLVVPKPTRFIPVAYAAARENSTLLEAFDAWLLAEKSNGNVDALYRYWMLGEAAKTEKKPRWSVIRDVLEWVD